MLAHRNLLTGKGLEAKILGRGVMRTCEGTIKEGEGTIRTGDNAIRENQDF